MFNQDEPRLVPDLKLSPDSSHFLTVDETKRPRANSDPVGLHPGLYNLPEITVTGDDGQDRSCGEEEDDEFDCMLAPPTSPRPRANTCPEDMFRPRKGRPPTPPPTELTKNAAGKRFSFTFNPKDLNGVSFAHHRLSKVTEDSGEPMDNQLGGRGKQQKSRRSRQPLTSGKPQPLPPISASGIPPESRHTHCNEVSTSCSKSSTPNVVHSPAHSTVALSITSSCDTRLAELSLTESRVSSAATTNTREIIPRDSSANSDVIICSSDSWRAKEASLDAVDGSGLKAY